MKTLVNSPQSPLFSAANHPIAVGTYVLMDEVYEKRRVSLREKEKPIENISVNKEEEEGEEEDKSKEETGEREETQHENETEEVEEQEVLADVKFRGLARKKIVFNRIISEVSTGKKVQSKKTKTNDQKPKKKDKKEKKNKKHKKDKKEKSSKSTEKPKKKQKISKS